MSWHLLRTSYSVIQEENCAAMLRLISLPCWLQFPETSPPVCHRAVDMRLHGYDPMPVPITTVARQQQLKVTRDHLHLSYITQVCERCLQRILFPAKLNLWLD